MELKPLKSFITVATLKNFSAAARELHTVQPAISRHIAALEEELGTQLFIRNTREVHITSAGLQLLKDAKFLIKQAEETKHRARQAAKGEMGSLKIGYLPSACLTFLPDLVRRFKAKYPNVEISLFEMTANAQLIAFDRDEIDIGISRPLPIEKKDIFRSELLYIDRLSMIVPSNHPYTKLDSVDLDKVSLESLILFERDSAVGLFDSIIKLCQKHHLTPRISAQPRHMQTLLTLVASGLGIAIAPGCVKKLLTKGCEFVPIAGDDTEIPTQSHYKQLDLSATAKAFLEISLESSAEIQDHMNQ